jgi:uncharacterized membrane protein
MRKTGFLLIILGVVLFMISELRVYLLNWKDFEHELTAYELDLTVNYYLWGFLLIVAGIVLIVISNLFKKDN